MFFKRQELRDIELVGNSLAYLAPDPTVSRFLMFLQLLIQRSKVPYFTDEIRLADLVIGSRSEIERREALPSKEANNLTEKETERSFYADLAISLSIGPTDAESFTRAEILKTVIGRLYHFRKVFDEVHKAVSADDVGLIKFQA